MVCLYWIFGIYAVIAFVVTIGMSIEEEDIAVGLATGLLWWFWLGRAVLRNMVRMLKEG